MVRFRPEADITKRARREANTERVLDDGWLRMKLIVISCVATYKKNNYKAYKIWNSKYYKT